MDRADLLSHQRNEADTMLNTMAISSAGTCRTVAGHERPQRIGKRRRRGGEHHDEAAEDKQDHPNAIEAAQRESNLVIDRREQNGKSRHHVHGDSHGQHTPKRNMGRQG